MAKGKKNQAKEQFHRAGKRITTVISKSIKDGKDDPELGWPGCPRFFPPVGVTK